MNQILSQPKNKKLYIILYLQFFISTAIIIVLGTYEFISYKKIITYEKTSKIIIDNYNITRLYNYQNAFNSYANHIFGFIEIPKINIYYSIFSNFSDENLKISPCKFAGKSINEFGNICIVGHNYDNNTFFSNLNKLEINDIINIYDINRNAIYLQNICNL